MLQFIFAAVLAAAPPPADVPEPSKDFIQSCFERARGQAELNFCSAGEAEAKKHELMDPEAVACFDKELSQMGMNMCSGAEFNRADKALNEAWAKARDITKGDPESAKLLLEAQRAWLKFREAQCKSVADQYRGGSILPLIANECMTDLTRERTKELVEFSTPEDER